MGYKPFFEPLSRLFGVIRQSGMSVANKKALYTTCQCVYTSGLWP
jgi:hypothetical protein